MAPQSTSCMQQVGRKQWWRDGGGGGGQAGGNCPGAETRGAPAKANKK